MEIQRPGRSDVGTFGVLCALTYGDSTKPRVMSQVEAAVTGVSNVVTGRFMVCENGDTTD